MTRLGKFVNSIFATILGLPQMGAQSIFSTILDWTAAMYAEFMLIVMRRIEQDFTPLLKPLIDKAQNTGKVPPEVQPLLDELKNPSAPIGALLGNAVGGGVSGGLVSSTIGPYLLLLQYENQRLANQARFDPKTALAIKFRRPDKKGLIESDLRDQGWTAERSELLENVAKTRLEEQFLVTLRLRGIIEQGIYYQRMYVLGYDNTEAEDFYIASFAYPGISDIVRMAVREAYTPEIAERFGQYQDIPPQFITEAAKLGIPDEIARQYWAAHWDLPSPMQGFDMLHRGIITEADLKLLLRALDVMPFWRDKLVQLAYAPFTRVDIRRMHKLGTLTEAQVKQSYQDIGYSPEKAAALTQFTVKLNTDVETEKEKELLKSDMLAAYRARLYTAEQAVAALVELGYVPADAKLIVDSTKQQALVQVKIPKAATRDLTVSQLKDLYQKELRAKLEINPFLVAFGFNTVEIAALYDLWDWEKPIADRFPSRTDYDNLLAANIITLDDWSNGYTLLGWDLKYQEWFYAQLVSSAPAERVSVPSKVELNKLIRKGIITLDEWSEGYTLLGYELKYQEWYFALYIYEGEEAPGG